MIGALLDHLWQSTLFCAAVWLTALTLRGNHAAVRHSLWMLASLKFLVPFSALHFVGAAAGLPTPVDTRPALLVQAIDIAGPVMSPVGVSGTDGAAWLGVLLAAAWTAGAALVAARWLRGWREFDHLSRAARPAPGTSPDVRVTDEDVEPSVVRVFDPVVLLPAALLGRLTRPQLNAVLSHEYEHIDRNDNLKAHLHRLAETLFWFFPPVWWIGRRLLEERERACDEAVLERGHDPADYAAGILAVCRHCAASQRPHAVAALGGDLVHRVRHILTHVPPASMGAIKAFSLTLCTLAAGAVPLIAGVLDGAAQRHAVLTHNSLLLDYAVVFVTPRPELAGGRQEVRTDDTRVEIRNSTLRELIALAYDVRSSSVNGGGTWLDSARYDFRLEASGPLDDPDDFDPGALRGVVNQLVASRFDLELYVDRRCQDPCGKRALETTAGY